MPVDPDIFDAAVLELTPVQRSVENDSVEVWTLRTAVEQDVGRVLDEVRAELLVEEVPTDARYLLGQAFWRVLVGDVFQNQQTDALIGIDQALAAEIIKDEDGVENNVLYTIYDHTKKSTKPTIFYTNYMLYEDAIYIRVIRRIVFQSFCIDFPVTDYESFLEITKIL